VASRRDFPGPFVPALHPGASPLYLFFGGKGGAGKTTCAAAAAIASAARGRRVLGVSTDPAHSLGDVLGRKLTARPSNVPVRGGSLKACELDADRALARWLADRRPALATILERGTWLDRGDIDPFLDLSLPGVDELLGLLEIERLASDGQYDQVVIDTAPTGHTLRLLATPATFEALARVLELMQEKHRVLAAALTRGSRRDASDALIDELRRNGERLAALLRDRTRTRLCWVTIPEELSVAESARAVDVLRADGIRVSDVIVNRVTPSPPSACALCDGRRLAEAKSLEAVSMRLGGRGTTLWTVPAREQPAQGNAALGALARSMSPLERSGTTRRARRTKARSVAAATAGRPLPPPVHPSPSTQLLIVGGKGGVGKTTCAATLALAIARDAPRRRVLLLSIDPAHSLGDVFGQQVGDIERRIRGGPRNLVARELDAGRRWHERREQYRESVSRAFEMLTNGSPVDLTIDRAVIEELFELAPPGMDEVAGMLTMIEALLPPEEESAAVDAARFDLVIVDTAPTGHALRLLALPAQAQAWVHQLMAVLLKYKIVGGVGQLASELVLLSRGFTRLQRLLTDPRACGFLIVTRPEELPALETIRLLEWLRRHRIPRRALIVNGVTPPGCARCRRIAARERRQLARLTSRPAWKRGGCAIVQTDAVAPPPRGVAALSEWGRTWRAGRGKTLE
jgi:arsenite-transporting ATPase